MLELADRHGVLPAVVANVENLVVQASCLQVSSFPGRQDARTTRGRQDACATILAPARAILVARAGLSLVLRSQLREIADEFARRHLPAAVLKGPDFADRLYPQPHFRPFTDIDLLIPFDARGEADSAMKQLGYSPVMVSMKHDDGYAEQSWRRGGKSGGTVEIH